MQGTLWNLLLYIEDGVKYFDNVAEALLYALLGFAVTFLGIAVLILLVWVVGKLLKLVTGKIEARNTLKKVSAEADIEPITEDGVPEHVRVAIIAAISAYYMSENSTCEFKVKRIKRL